MKNQNLLLITLLSVGLLISACGKNTELHPEQSYESRSINESGMKALMPNRDLDEIMLDPINYSPAPFIDITRITFHVKNSNTVSLYITDDKHKVVAVMNTGYREEGFYQFMFDATGMPAGEYTVHLQVGETMTKEYMIKLDNLNVPTESWE